MPGSSIGLILRAGRKQGVSKDDPDGGAVRALWNVLRDAPSALLRTRSRESLKLARGQKFMQRKVLVTGGAGFIGSAVCRRLVADGASVLNLDALTYAGNLKSLATIDNAPNYRFAKVDVATGGRSPRRSRRSAGSRDPLGRWSPRRSVDHGQRRLRPDQCRRHLLDARGGASLLAGAAGAADGTRSASCTSPPTRSTAR